MDIWERAQAAEGLGWGRAGSLLHSRVLCVAGTVLALPCPSLRAFAETLTRGPSMYRQHTPPIAVTTLSLRGAAGHVCPVHMEMYLKILYTLGFKNLSMENSVKY